MQHGPAGDVDGFLGHTWHLGTRAPLVTTIGFAALVAGWIGCLVLVATLILRG